MQGIESDVYTHVTIKYYIEIVCMQSHSTADIPISPDYEFDILLDI